MKYNFLNLQNFCLQKCFRYLGVALICLVWYLSLASSQLLLAQQQEPLKYKIIDIYIIGLDALSEEPIQRYLKENGIRLEALRSRRQLEAAAHHLASAAADGDATLLAIDTVLDYDDNGESGPEVYVEILVSEMSIQFIPGGGNAYVRFGWANRIPRNGRPSLIWLAAGYNRQDVTLELPYLGGTIFGFEVQAGHQIRDQWDFAETSRIRSVSFVMPQLYIQPLTWLKLGAGLDAGLLYFFQGQNPDTWEIGNDLGLGPELATENVPGRFHGHLAVLSNLELDRDYLARKGLGYHLRFCSRHELLGLYAGNHGLSAELGMVTEPLSWLRPSLGFRTEWRSQGMLPLKSEVFSSNFEGYIRGAGELRVLLMPLHVKDPLRMDIGLNLGAIVGFANVTSDFGDINLERDLELSLFAGPEWYLGMPINVRAQFDFGIIFRKQFQEVGFAFHIRVM